MNRPRLRAWFAALALVLLGVAVGAAGTGWLGLRAIRRAVQAPAGAVGPADRAAARIAADLTNELALTPEQSAQVQTILNQSATNLKAIRADAMTAAAAELRATTERIATALPPEKHAALHRVLARRYERLGLTPPPFAP